MLNGNIDQFLNSSAINETWWYMDSDTNEIVCYCKSCDAEARCTVETYQEFQFAHNDSCRHSDERRGQRLVEEMMKVLEEETDQHVALSAVTFVSAILCAVAATEGEVSPDVVAQRFVSAFEQRSGDVGQAMEIVSARENAA